MSNLCNRPKEESTTQEDLTPNVSKSKAFKSEVEEHIEEDHEEIEKPPTPEY